MALSTFQSWWYFDPTGTDQAAARTALRARLGACFTEADFPDDKLDNRLDQAVAHVHNVTDRFFLIRSGDLRVDGLGDERVYLPHPIVATSQTGTGITAVAVRGFDDTIDIAELVVNEGVEIGRNDPRNDPWIEFDYSDTTYSFGSVSRFPEGSRNVVVTGTFGYVEANGSTPELILHAIARLVIWLSPDLDDFDGQEDKSRGARLIEQTRGRMIQLQQHAAGAGLTTDREIDGILRRYTRPIQARVLRSLSQRSSRNGRGRC